MGADAPAQALFDEGRALMTAQRYAEACDKFARSQQLAPAVGTLINLGECSEALGKMASAWSSYKEAANLAARLNDNRVDYALRRASAVEPRISRLTIRIAGNAAREGLDVFDNGVKVEPALFDTAIPLDAGRHEISARAPGTKVWRQEIQLEEGAQATVEVPALEAEVVQPERDPPAGPGRKPSEVRRRPPAVKTGRPVPAATYVLLGTTVLGGVGFGVLASMGKSEKKDLERPVDEGGCSPLCTDEDLESAKTRFLLGDISLGIGLASAVGAFVTYVTRPTKVLTTGRGEVREFQVVSSGSTNLLRFRSQF